VGGTETDDLAQFVASLLGALTVPPGHAAARAVGGNGCWAARS
jgi:hypothetical protein